MAAEPIARAAAARAGGATISAIRWVAEELGAMKRKAYGRDAGLTARMFLTSGMLGLVYVVFAVVLFELLNAGLVLMLVIVGGMALLQYFTSDKLALAASGAKVVEREQAPELHAMVERLCA